MWIDAIGHHHPANRIDNHFFDGLGIGSDAGWVEDRTGIKSRRSVLLPETIRAVKEGTIDLASLRTQNQVQSIASLSRSAWIDLTSRATHITCDDIDLVICGTSIPDFDIPANACPIAAEIGFNCAAFDVNSACSSFVVDLHVARSLLATGAYHNIAIFNPERYSLRMNYSDRSSAVLFGDGCSAVTVRAKSGEGLRVVDTVIHSDPAHYSNVAIEDGGHFHQRGNAVQKFAISRTIECTRQILKNNKLTADDLDYFIGHQANLRMVSSAAARLGIPEHKHLHNVEEFGNQGAAGAPCVLSMNWHRFRSGDKIVVSVVGSGLTWGAALLEKT